MEIFQWKKNKKGEDIEIKNGNIIIRVSPEEAYKIIKSLSSQLVSQSPNNGREEMYTNKGEYVSIAVHFPPAIPPGEEEIDFIYSKINREANHEQRNFANKFPTWPKS